MVSFQGKYQGRQKIFNNFEAICLGKLVHIRAAYQYFDGKIGGSTIPDGGFAQLYLNCSGRYDRI